MKEYTTPDFSVITVDTDIITTSVDNPVVDSPVVEFGW